MFQWKATNVIFLNDDVGGKGKYFKARFLQAGLVKYSFGVCELSKETIDKFVQDFVGCPVIINHKEVTNESAKDDRVGTISKVWFDETDGWYWCEGIIFEQEAIDLINQGYSVSCQYEITEYSENKTGALHNGNPYDKTILNGKPEHLAIVKNPRYENAMIAVNALEIDMENKEHKAKNGWITAKTGNYTVDEEGNEKMKKEQEPPKQKVKNNIIEAINEIKETTMFKNLFKKRSKEMEKEELKTLFMECLQDMTARNEAVDKRKLIDEIGGILKGKVDDEIIRTIIKKAEELSYNPSEKDKADNEAEEEKEEVKEEKEEKKDDAENKCGKNEETENCGKNADDEEKKEAKNAMDEQKNMFYSHNDTSASCSYLSKSKAIELGNQLF